MALASYRLVIELTKVSLRMERYKAKGRLFTRMDNFLKEFFIMGYKQMGSDLVLMESLSQ